MRGRDGEAGPRGRPGPPGSNGAPGAAGPAGAAAYTLLSTPGTSPAPTDCDRYLQSEACTLGQTITVIVVARVQNDSNKTWRELRAEVILNVTSGGLIQNAMIGTTAGASGPGWIGAASIAFSYYTSAPNVHHLRVTGAGPTSATTCTWGITAQLLSRKFFS